MVASCRCVPRGAVGSQDNMKAFAFLALCSTLLLRFGFGAPFGAAEEREGRCTAEAREGVQAAAR